jgi:hypothetical protein
VKLAARFTITHGSRMMRVQTTDIWTTKTALSIFLSVSQLVFVSPLKVNKNQKNKKLL